MTLPPEISKLSPEEAQANLNNLTDENENLKAELCRYQKAPDLSAFLKQVLHIFQDAFLRTAPDTAGLLCAIVFIWLIDWATHHAVGDKKFFSWIPISYFFDAAHVAMLLKFFLFLFKNFGASRSK